MTEACGWLNTVAAAAGIMYGVAFAWRYKPVAVDACSEDRAAAAAPMTASDGGGGGGGDGDDSGGRRMDTAEEASEAREEAAMAAPAPGATDETSDSGEVVAYCATALPVPLIGTPAGKWKRGSRPARPNATFGHGTPMFWWLDPPMQPLSFPPPPPPPLPACILDSAGSCCSCCVDADETSPLMPP